MSKHDVFVIRLASGRIIHLQEGVKLSTEDISGLGTRSADGAFAAVGRNPRDPAILGLENLSSQAWAATVPGDGHRRIEPARSLKLADGTTINFGPVVGTIREGAGGFSLSLPSRPAISLRAGVRLIASDLLGMGGSPSGRLAAEVGRNPTDPTVLGLKNLSGQVWSAMVPGGGQRRIDPGKSIKLAAGTQINFGAAEGEIQWDTSVSAPAQSSSSDPVRNVLEKLKKLLCSRQSIGLCLSLVAGMIVAHVLPFVRSDLGPVTVTILTFLTSFVLSFAISLQLKRG